MGISHSDFLTMQARLDARQVKNFRQLVAVRQSEADLHDQILSECRRRAWPVVHSRMDRPTTSAVGTPDFVIALPKGRTLWIEAKTAHGKLTMEQRTWLFWLQKLGHRAFVVRSFQDFLSVLNSL